MTFKEKVLDLLYNNGMFQDQAEQVLERVVTDDACTDFQGRWNDRVEDYPSLMVNLLWMAVKRVALAWINENCPQAWFKPLFDDASEVAAKLST
jgi:hypothetical protein